MVRRLVRLSILFVLVLNLAPLGCGDDDDGGPPPDPLVAGPYPVGVTQIELFDEEQGRVQLTEVWYPAAESARGLEPAGLETYLPAGLEDIAADATVPLVAVREAEISPDAPFPLIAFSHGNGGVRFQNTFQCEHLASHGYVVLAPDHQGNTFFDNAASFEELLVARPLDIIFLLDSFASFATDPDSRFSGWVDPAPGFGATGHSFGAYTSLAAAEQDDRIVAVMPLAVGLALSEEYDSATFYMLGVEDKTIGIAGNQAILDSYEDAPPPRYLAEVIDAGHYSFTFACEVGFDGPWTPDGCGSNTRFADGSPFEFVDHMRVWDVVEGYSAAFFGRYLKNIHEYDEVLATNLDPEIVGYTVDPGVGE